MTPPPRLTAYCPVCGFEVGTFRLRRHLSDDHTRTEVLAAAWRTAAPLVRVAAVLITVSVVIVCTTVMFTVAHLIGG